MGMNLGYYGKRVGAGLLAILPLATTTNEVQAQQTVAVQIPTVTVHGVRPGNSSLWKQMPAGFLDHEGVYEITCGLHVAYVNIKGTQDNAVVFPTRDDSVIVQAKNFTIKFSGRVQQKPDDLTPKEAINYSLDAVSLINFCEGIDIEYTLHPGNDTLDIDGTRLKATARTITVRLPTGPIGYKQTNYGRAMMLALGQVN